MILRDCFYVRLLVLGSKEKVKEKPGKDEKKSKVRPMFWGCWGGGRVGLSHERWSETSGGVWSICILSLSVYKLNIVQCDYVYIFIDK